MPTEPVDPAAKAPGPVPPGPPPGDVGGLHRRLTLNSISNVSRYGISLVVAFFITPYMVHTLGDAQFGFWVVLLSFAGYAGILEMGVQPAVVRLVGQAKGQGDLRKLSELISAAFVFFLGVGVFCAVVFAFLLPSLAPHLVKQVQFLGHAGPLFLLIAADVAVMFLTYLVSGILYGWQMYHAKNLIDIAAWILNAGLVLLLLARGGLTALAAIKLGTDLVALVATAVVCRRAIPGLGIQVRGLGWSSFRELLSFGGKVFISATTTRLNTNAQPIIVSSMISAAATAVFSIPVRLVDYVRQIVWALATGFMPMFSELSGREESGLIRSIYLKYSRYILLGTLPILALVFVYGRDFIRLWISPEYAEQGGTALLLLAGAALVEGLQPLVWRLFLGVGKLDFLVAVSAASSLAAILLAILLVKPMGITGVALSVFLTTAVAQVLFAEHVARYLEIPMGGMLREIHLQSVLTGSALFLLVTLLARFLGKDSYLAIGLGSTLGLLVYVPLAWAVALTAGERAWLLRTMNTRVLRRAAPSPD